MDWLNNFNPDSPKVSVIQLVIRLLTSLVLGAMVAQIYRLAKPPRPETHAFATTLVLLCIVIAMVTQVIGDNVARAFSLVGALSIVRFRTVVQDTRDTAYVIFSVVVGMAVGASNLHVAVGGIVVVGLATAIYRSRDSKASPHSRAGNANAEVTIRFAAGHDPVVGVQPILAKMGMRVDLLVAETVQHGAALECTYRVHLQPGVEPTSLVRELNRTEGVQSVALRRKKRKK